MPYLQCFSGLTVTPKYLLVLPATAKRPAVQLYTSVFLDDATRLVTGLRVYERQDIRCVMDCFRHAIETNGVPEELYTDYTEEKIMPKVS